MGIIGWIAGKYSAITLPWANKSPKSSVKFKLSASITMVKPNKIMASAIAQQVKIFLRAKVSTIHPVAKKKTNTGDTCIKPTSAR